MLKLTLRQKITLWLGQHRRSMVLAGAGVVALLLTALHNAHISQPSELAMLLTLCQLGAGILLVLLLIILTD